MFQEDFKYYKSRTKKPSLENVLDFSKDDLIEQNSNVSRLELTLEDSCTDPAVNSCYFLKPVEQWPVYEVRNRPGLLFIRNPFTALGQKYWTVRSLRDYSQKPNKSNIDNQNILSEKEDWWTISNDTYVDVNRRKNLLKKMRWVTLGYHHNWNTKEYDFENKNEFPDDLNNLCKHIAKTLSLSNDYQAEAAIMNFYSEGDTLSGHTDHSEPYKLAPLISLSFGQSCIFLLGGPSKDIKPSAIQINSGDICILSEQARLCYHAVPLILKAPHEPWEYVQSVSEKNGLLPEEDLFTNKIDVKTFKDLSDDVFFKPYDQFLSERRINLNVRQVMAKKD